MSPRRTREQPRQNNGRNDHGDFASLEAELHASRKPNRQERRAVERTAQGAEAHGFARVTGKHFRSRPSA